MFGVALDGEKVVLTFGQAELIENDVGASGWIRFSSASLVQQYFDEEVLAKVHYEFVFC